MVSTAIYVFKDTEESTMVEDGPTKTASVSGTERDRYIFAGVGRIMCVLRRLTAEIVVGEYDVHCLCFNRHFSVLSF